MEHTANFFSHIRRFGLCGWLHCLGMAAWCKLTSKSLHLSKFQTFQINSCAFQRQPLGHDQVPNNPSDPQKIQWPLAVLCRKAARCYSPPEANGQFSTNWGLWCMSGPLRLRSCWLCAHMRLCAEAGKLSLFFLCTRLRQAFGPSG